jgi:hypothetical protein
VLAADETIDAIAASVNILDRDEAARLVHTVVPHYRNGRLTSTGLLAACRLLYTGFDRYPLWTKAALLREARAILQLGDTAATLHPQAEPATAA